MAERPQTPISLTRLAIERIEDGDISDARSILAEALAADPAYEPAWLWFAQIAEDVGEKRYCLERAAAISPSSVARQELVNLRRTESVAPPEVLEMVTPPPLPTFAPAATGVRGTLLRERRHALLFGILGALAALAAIIALFVFVRGGEQPIYIAVVGVAGRGDGGAGGETVDSVRLYTDGVNAAGGINGHPIELLVYDDENDPEMARTVAEQIVADGRAVAVVGHRTSPTSLAAAPIYAAAKIPAITGSATADALTADHPWYFRTVFDNRMQGTLIAAYIRYVLDEPRISIVAGTADYGQSLAEGVVAAFTRDGTIVQQLELNTQGDRFDESLASAVATLRAESDPGVIVIALQADVATPAVEAIRAAGITAQIVGGDAMGSDTFLESLADPEASEGLIAASPLIMDSLTRESLRWFDAFQSRYDREPTWRGATVYDAAIVLTAALRSAGVTGEAGARAAERTGVRNALAAFDGPERAAPGLLGPIYFDENRTTPRTAYFGIARAGQYISAPEQLHWYAAASGLGPEDDLTSGAAIEIEGKLLEKQRIVFAGININEVGELDTANPSFYADFFLWFNYRGDDSATDVVFTNAVKSKLVLGDPVRTAEAEDGTKYRLYRVTGRFKAPLRFEDFPFDKQQLLVSFQNRTLPSSRMVYAVDQSLRDLPQVDRLRSGTNAAVSINAIPSWRATEADVYQDSVGSTALLGDPEASIGASGIEYSVFTSDVTIERDLSAFLGKNLLPLVLLALVTYVSLFFPHSLTEARVTFGVSGILTAAFLLQAVTGVLPQVGYTVAIEWGFYAFIVLSASCIIFGLMGHWLYEDRRLSDLRRLDLFSRIFYPLVALAVVLAYVARFGNF